MRFEFISTGIEGFDEIVKGYPKGSTILIAGEPGAGKSTFATQFLHKLCTIGKKVIYVSFNEKRDEFFTHMYNIGFNLYRLEEEELFHFVWYPITKHGVHLITEDLLNKLSEIKPEGMVIDSITSLTGLIDERSAREFLHNIIHLGVKPLQCTCILIADLPHGRQVIGYGFEEFLVDAVIILKFEEFKGITRRILEIRKVRWCEVPRLTYEFVIGRGGIKIYSPHVKGLIGSYSFERISSGIKELDEMLGGGFPKNSTILIYGPSGSGKTIIALNFAISGVLNNEKVIYISFEESINQLITLLKSMNQIGKYLYKNLYILSIDPRRFTPGTLYWYLRYIIDKVKPSRLVIDGLSAIEKYFGVIEFQSFVRNLTTYCKNIKITTLLTHAKLTPSKETEVSTLADVIIKLWFRKVHNRFEKMITVLKARGIKHDVTFRKIEFSNGKLVIV